MENTNLNGFYLELWKKFSKGEKRTIVFIILVLCVLLPLCIAVIFFTIRTYVVPTKPLDSQCITTHDSVVKVNRNGLSETIYRIYVPGFKNSDSSTIQVGDISGLEEKLDYFQEMNISILWISSLQKIYDDDYEELTSFDDLNLDLAYKDNDIDTLQHFINNANTKGMKVIMDITINHSSHFHKWFTESKKNSSIYRDFYHWHPGRNISGQRQPPNNWTTVTGESAWTWDNDRQAYYFHRFNSRKPDLNWRNENVRQEMKKVITLWLTRGFFGLYIRDFPYLIDGDWENADQSSVIDIPENMDILNIFQEQILSWKNQNNVSDDRLLLFSSTEKTRKAEVIRGVLLGLVDDVLYKMKPSTATEWREIVRGTINRSCEKNTFPVWILGNEMTSRIATKFGPKAATDLQYVQMLLPGSSVIYYGEEIGMTDLPNDDKNSTIKQLDRYRSPMQWNDKRFAGFSTKPEVWPPVNSNYKKINVDSQMKNFSSLWYTMKTLIDIKRSSDADLNDNIGFPADLNDGDVFTFTRSNLNESIDLLVVLNAGTSPRNLSLQCTLNLGDFRIIHPKERQNSIKNGTNNSQIVLEPSDAMVLTRARNSISIMK